MRWKINKKEKPRFGDKRKISKFAWLPTKVSETLYDGDISDEEDTVIWLKDYIESQEYIGTFAPPNGRSPAHFVEKWVTRSKYVL